MGSLREIELLARELMKTDFEVPCGYGINRTFRTLNANNLNYSFKFDSARSRFGCCKTSFRNGKATHGTISLSRALCNANLGKVHGKVKDTILHEIAHAFTLEIYGRGDGNGHGHNWVRTAQAIGCNGNRCYNNQEVTQVTNTKYTNTCPVCDNKTSSHKRRTRSYACTPCCKKNGGGYDARFKLIVTQNY